MNSYRDLFNERLDQFDYQVVRAELEAINEETQRIEFKRELDLQAVTKEVIALANAIGGLVVIGFEDPSLNKPLTPFGNGPAIDDRERRRLMSRIQAKVYPALDLEVWAGYDAGGAHGMLIIRVPESRNAPHESLDERGRFPVRRGTQIGYLGLREIEQLLRRRDVIQGGATSRIFAYPEISFDRNPPDLFVGIRLSPEHPAPVRLLTRSLQQRIVDVVRCMPGLQRTKVETLADGVLFVDESDNAAFENSDSGTWERLRRRCYVRADGQIELRFPQDTSALVYQLYRVFGDAYAVSSEVLRTLGAGPRVREVFAYKLKPTPDLGPFPIGRENEIPLEADLSRDSLSDVAAETLLYSMRHAGETGEYEEFVGSLDKFWQDNYGTALNMGDPRRALR